jgi:hypothetical protein
VINDLNWKNFVATFVTIVFIFGAGFNQSNGQKKEGLVSSQASGTFEVKMTPQDDKTGLTGLGRFTIDKQLEGDFVGTSKGQMLTAMTSVEGSAGYVAIERLTGTLKGRKGTFALQHSGTMNRAAQQLTITVVPDSGTEELTGLAGVMKIKIEGGKHFYEFNYTLP